MRTKTKRKRVSKAPSQAWTFEEADRMMDFLDWAKFRDPKLYQGLMRGEVEFKREWIDPLFLEYVGW